MACRTFAAAVAAAVALLGAAGTSLPAFAAAHFEFTEPAVFTYPVGVGSRSKLVVGADGAFYGTTGFGGAHKRGTIFRFVPGGAIEAVYSFSGPQGSNPLGDLLLLADGSLWGTTRGGGLGHGTVFRFDPATRLLTTVHAFDGSDGHKVLSTLIQARDGMLYGTSNGSFDYEPQRLPGSIYRIDPVSAQFTLLKRFTRYGPQSDLGRQPTPKLLQARDGFIYGTSYLGGAKDVGTLFRLDPATREFVLIHDFGGKVGCKPFGGLIQARDQRLYGTATQCGARQGGTVYRVRDRARVEPIHAFGAPDDAYFPGGELLEASDGFLYGSSSDVAYGSLFRMRLDGGRYQRFYRFRDGQPPSHGFSPFGGLTEHDGALWGTTESDSGSIRGGSIYKLTRTDER